jgi:deazaflavin-dependent oxidoreductase (nitroreductase family)
MDGVHRSRKATLVTTAQKWTVNPLFRLLTGLGLAPGYAVLETIGRKTGLARRVPVANGTVGDKFWIVAEQGRRAAWALNVEANPRVRVLTGRRWRTGTAELLPDDDSAARFGKEIPAWNEWFVRKVGTDMLTVRVRFDV